MTRTPVRTDGGFCRLLRSLPFLPKQCPLREFRKGHRNGSLIVLAAYAAGRHLENIAANDSRKKNFLAGWYSRSGVSKV